MVMGVRHGVMLGITIAKLVHRTHKVWILSEISEPNIHALFVIDDCSVLVCVMLIVKCGAFVGPHP